MVQAFKYLESRLNLGQAMYAAFIKTPMGQGKTPAYFFQLHASYLSKCAEAYYVVGGPPNLTKEEKALLPVRNEIHEATIKELNADLKKQGHKYKFEAIMDDFYASLDKRKDKIETDNAQGYVHPPPLSPLFSFVCLFVWFCF